MGRYKEALECSDRALEANPHHTDALNNKGILLRRTDKYQEALECYEKALEINQEDIDVWNSKGVLLGKMGNYDKALECYEKALEISPTYELARNNRNLTLIFLGRFDEAKEEREKLYSEKKKEISKSKISPEEKKEKILEIEVKKKVVDELRHKCKEILDAKNEYKKKLSDLLRPRSNSLNDNILLVLRRWNSYTPAMLTATRCNFGGGYFLYWKGKGIVIDPGFDFLNNFFNSGLVIYDIDVVIITHAHVDHCSDFESILTLIFEYNEKRKKKKKIDLFMNVGTMKKLLRWIPMEEDKENTLINRLYPLERGISYYLENYSLRLKVTKAIHDEVLSKTYSVGLIFELFDGIEYTIDRPFKIGYTSDTRHDEDVEEQYNGVDIVIPHLGSIDENDFSLEDKERDENHLMLRGIVSTIYRSDAKLAIISEFGEELGEHRLNIVNTLNRIFQENGITRCLTGDIGLAVSIPDLKIKCHYCEEFVSMDDISEGVDPANKDKKCIIYYCKDCKKVFEAVPSLFEKWMLSEQRSMKL